MELLKALPGLIGGSEVEIEGEGTARRIRLGIAAAAATALASGLYGLSAGIVEPALAAGNLLKVPLVVLLSGVAALPAGLLAAKLMETDFELTDMVTSLVSANFTGSLVLVAGAPVVALYYLTGSMFSAHIGLAVGILAEIVAIWVFFRAAHERRPEGTEKRHIFVPLALTSLVQLVVLVQLLDIASPILPEITLLTQGMDGLLTL